MLKELGYNQREIDYMRKNMVDPLPGLYYGELIEKFKDEYKPFEANLNYLHGMTARKFLLEKARRRPRPVRWAASNRHYRQCGTRRSGASGTWPGCSTIFTGFAAGTSG